MKLVNVFQYYSDIHLEHHQDQIFYIERVKLPSIDEVNSTIKYNLILAGDIGSPSTSNYWVFLQQVSKIFDRVFLICGNHEYYGASIEGTSKLLRNKIANEKLHNIYFLENDFIFIDNLMIVGSTLWSHIPAHARLYVLQDIVDYRFIENFSIDQANERHATATSFIAKCLDKAEEQHITNKIVITHHAPVMQGTSDPRYKGFTNHAFASDLTKLVTKASHWVYGHTHYNPTSPVMPNMYTNQVGYNWTLSDSSPDSYFLIVDDKVKKPI